MRKLNEHYLNAFLSKCTDKKKIRDAWEKGDYWMSAQEAKENGFVTEVTGKAKVDKATAQMITNCGYTGEITASINNEKSKNDMDLTMLTTRFGMDASTTEAQFIAQVDVWKRKADRVDMLERQEEARKEQEIENILNSAIKEKRITADVRDDWKANLTSNFDTANKKFEDLQNDPEALKNIMEKNPAEYERLLNDYIKRNGK